MFFKKNKKPVAGQHTASLGPSNHSSTSPIEQRIHTIGGELLAAARKRESGLLSARFWQDKLMDWAMKDEAFKVQLFRFVDVFPMLNTKEQIHDHLVEYLTQPGVTLPAGMVAAIKAGSVAKGMAGKTITSQITAMAEKFIAGVDAASAVPMLRKLRKQRIAFSVDLLGEACVSDREADEYRERYLDLVQTLRDEVRQWKADDLLDIDHLGKVPRANVSIKVSSLHAQTDPICYERTLDELVDSISPILEVAGSSAGDVLINFDMESHALKDLTLDLFIRCCEKYDFQAGIAMQAYLQSGDHDAKRIITWSKQAGRQVTVRLVKGAYWDYEVVHAEQMNWPTPVWTAKHDTDACFERMSQLFVDAIPTSKDEGGVKFALGSHNVRSIAAAMSMLEQRDLPSSAIELQMLHGMADPLKFAAIDRGLRVREYVPVGEMIPGMAYLVRRLLENTSNESWLRAGFSDDAPVDVLLANPATVETKPANIITADPQRHHLSAAVQGVGDDMPFMTEPHHDFSDEIQREVFAKAVDCSSIPQVANDGTVEQANEAVTIAHRAFAKWRDVNVTDRSNMLIKAAAEMRRRRDELAGIMIREAGKPWREADGDVAEAIDFCEYYARQAGSLFEPRRLGKFVGELNHQFHQPRGVAVVISPWNFPLAICCGMTVAALVTGNTAIVKPAEQTPGIARVMCEMLWNAGIPRDVLHFLPGAGETVGAALVRDPRTAIIAFTGSKAVGLDIIKAAGVTTDEQSQVKKVVCEMGGKNAIIVDSSADLDEAVLGVRDSAFGFAGQKCSACSRAIVLDDAHDVFLKRLVEASRALVVGDPIHAATDIGPVIDVEAGDKIQSYIEIGRTEGNQALGDDQPRGDVRGKPLIGPHIFAGIRGEHRLAREEIFGPVLAVMKVKSFDEAMTLANATDYKLTGGLFTRTPSHLDRARREFRVGNLYLNRGNTGALVGRQPFGGFGMSGVGSKAGGAEYLHQFVEPRVVTENTMRHGFAPME